MAYVLAFRLVASDGCPSNADVVTLAVVALQCRALLQNRHHIERNPVGPGTSEQIPWVILLVYSLVYYFGLCHMTCPVKSELVCKVWPMAVWHDGMTA